MTFINIKNRELLTIIKWGSIAFISNLVLKLFTVPYIQKSTGGYRSFDLSPLGYNKDYALEYIGSMSSRIINFYSFVQIPIDIIFPVSTCIFSLLLFKYFRKRVDISKLVYILPISCCLMDITENVLILVMLNHTVSQAVVSITSFMTRGKFLSGSIYALILLIVFIVYKGKR